MNCFAQCETFPFSLFLQCFSFFFSIINSKIWPQFNHQTGERSRVEMKTHSRPTLSHERTRQTEIEMKFCNEKKENVCESIKKMRMSSIGLPKLSSLIRVK